MNPPSQTQKEQRAIRGSYRDLIHKVESLEKSDFPCLVDALNTCNGLFANVFSTQEATLDARVLTSVGNAAVLRAKSLKMDGGSFDKDDFIERFRSKIFANALNEGQRSENNGPDASQRNDNDESNASQRDDYEASNESQRGDTAPNWFAHGDSVIKYLLRAPCIDFMLGPLAVRPKVQKLKRAREKDVEVRGVMKPQQLEEKDIEKQENETSANVAAIFTRLHELGRTNIFKFLINPDSFGQSVENLFYLSFLIKENAVEISEDEETFETFVEPYVKPIEGEDAPNEELETQMILSINEQLWKEAIRMYRITTSLIPHRLPRDGALSNGNKWY